MSKYTKDILYDLIITKGLSYEEIGRMYNVTGAAIKKQLLGMVLIYLKEERLILMKFSGKISLGKSLLEPVNIVENL